MSFKMAETEGDPETSHTHSVLLMSGFHVLPETSEYFHLSCS